MNGHTLFINDNMPEIKLSSIGPTGTLVSPALLTLSSPVAGQNYWNDNCLEKLLIKLFVFLTSYFHTVMMFLLL